MKGFIIHRTACVAVLLAVGLPTASFAATTAGQSDMTATSSSEEASHAVKHVDQAYSAIEQMTGNPQLTDLLREAKGVFIVPDYGRAALLVGGQGGPGVLLVHRDGKWTGPAFYNLAGVSIGAQVGVAGGKVALILMDDKALDAFGKHNKFSLNSDAGLTLIDYSARAHGAAGRGDIVMWSDTKGAFANASLSVTDIHFDRRETEAYYGHRVEPMGVVEGVVATAKADRLTQALPA